MPKTATKPTVAAYRTFAGLREAKVIGQPQDRTYEVVILTEGKGNPKDKHYYPTSCVQDPATAKAFEGKPCFLNHPDAFEEQVQPERKVQDIAGYFMGVHAEGNALKASLKLTKTPAGMLLESLIQDCLEFSGSFPGENLAGISINANGPTRDVELEGEVWKQVDRIVEATSADAVTLPARGGEFLKKLESLRKAEASDPMAGVKRILTVMRDKLNAGAVDPKTLRRMVDNALTASEGNIPSPQGGESMKNAKKVEAKKGFAQMSEDEAKSAAKALHAWHAGKAAQCEDEGEKGIHQAAAEKYKAMCGEEEAEGDLTITHKPTDGEEPPAEESEAKGKKESEEESKKGKKEAEEESEEESKMESLRKENRALYLDKVLSESGLPEVFHKGIRLVCQDKSNKQIDEIVESRVQEQDYQLKESGNSARPAHVGKAAAGVNDVLAKHNL